MARSVLLLLGVCPYDRTNGAARDVRAVCEILAEAGYTVSALTPTANVLPGGSDPVAQIRAEGREPRDVAVNDEPNIGRVLRFADRGVRYAMLDTGAHGFVTWENEHDAAFTALLEDTLANHAPDVIYTFGGTPPEQRWRRRARETGAAVVFTLHNHGYYHPLAFNDTDAVIACSRFLAQRYKQRVGIDATPIPQPMLEADVVAPARSPKYVTFVNPEVNKGVLFFARLADELGARRPDIPVMVVESRGTERTLDLAAREIGVDLRARGNIRVSPGVSRPRAVFAVTRALVAPSVFEEPFGRVAAEAICNGAPPIVFDRGGLREACNGAGFVMTPPAHLLDSFGKATTPADVAPWIDVIERLYDDAAFYTAQSDAALAASRAFSTGVLGPKFVSFFDAAHRRDRQAASGAGA